MGILKEIVNLSSRATLLEETVSERQRNIVNDLLPDLNAKVSAEALSDEEYKILNGLVSQGYVKVVPAGHIEFFKLTPAGKTALR